MNNLNSYKTLPYSNTQSVEIEKKTTMSINETDKRELLEIVRKQQKEIEQLKSRLDTVTINSSKLNEYGSVK